MAGEPGAPFALPGELGAPFVVVAPPGELGAPFVVARPVFGDEFLGSYE